jgi:hypothetical protein
VHEICLGLGEFGCCHSFCFWLEIMSPTFISSYYVLQKSIPFSLIMPQRFFTRIHTPFLQFWCELSRYPPSTHFVLLEYTVHNMASTVMANTKFQGNLISCNVTVFLYHSFNMLHCLWFIDSVRPPWAVSISYTSHPHS